MQLELSLKWNQSTSKTGCLALTSRHTFFFKKGNIVWKSKVFLLSYNKDIWLVIYIGYKHKPLKNTVLVVHNLARTWWQIQLCQHHIKLLVSHMMWMLTGPFIVGMTWDAKTEQTITRSCWKSRCYLLRTIKIAAKTTFLNPVNISLPL